jgi:hypothetical protein
MPCNHLRGGVTRRPARSFQQLPFLEGVAKAKVCDLDDPAIVGADGTVEQQILRLQITMHNALPVYLLHSSKNLMEEATSITLPNATTGYDVVE